MTVFLVFLIAWATRTVLVVAVAGGLFMVGNRYSASARNSILRGALVAVVLIPVGMAVTPFVRIPVKAMPNLATRLIMPEVQSQPPQARQIDIQYVPTPTDPIHEIASLDPWLLAFMAYLFGLVCLVFRWIESLRLVRGICRDAKQEDGDSIGVLATTDQRLSVPITFGWRHPIIVLPAGVVKWPEGRYDTVIRHEQAHIERNDWLWQGFAYLIASLQWFNPASWLLLSLLRSTAEVAADDAVLAFGVTPSKYANDLLFFASDRTSGLSAATSMLRKAGVHSRVRSILATNKDRRQATRRFAICMALGFITGGIVFGALKRVDPFFISMSAKTLASLEWDPAMGHGEWPAGNTVNVNFVGTGDSSQPVWGIDGTPVDHRVVEAKGNKYGPIPPLPGTRVITICYTVHEPVKDDGWVVTDSTDTPKGGIRRPLAPILMGQYHTILGGLRETGTSQGGGLGQFDVCTHFYVPADWKQCPLTIGMGVGDFREVARMENGKGALRATIVATSNGVIPPQHGVGAFKPSAQISKVTFEVPKRIQGLDWRLLGYGKDGKLLDSFALLAWNQAMPVRGDPNLRVALYPDPPRTIKKLVLEARLYAWKQIPLVHLYPQSGVKG